MILGLTSRRSFALIVTVAACLFFLHDSQPQDAIAHGDASLSPPRDTFGPINDVAAQDPLVKRLHREAPALDIEHAVLAIKDANGNIWSTRSRDGDLCLIERTASSNGRAGGGGWMCRHRAAVEHDGIVGGVPGHWIGLAPTPSSTVSATTADGTRHRIETSSTGVFRLPATAISVTLGGSTHHLRAPA
jgi:hypothetical protein